MADETKKVQPFAGVASGGSHSPQPIELQFPNEKTVTMVFPKAILLNTDKNVLIEFKAGPQEVPESLVDHWYLKKNGVLTYAEAQSKAAKKTTVTAPLPDYAVTEHHVKYLKFKGYPVEDIDDAKAHVEDLSEPAKVKFFKAAGEWKEPATPEEDQELTNLEIMRKDELIAYAKDKFNLDLPTSMKKEDMMDAIYEAASKQV